MPRLKPGTRALNSKLPSLVGVVESVSDWGTHTVVVDPEFNHFSRTIRISEDEIVSEKDYEIADAKRQVEYAVDGLKDTRADMAALRRRKAKQLLAVKDARAELRAIRRKHGA